MMFNRVRRIHFVGIGGAGMNGIAEILLTMGFEVSGSDLALSEVTRRLSVLGGKIASGHDPVHIEGADVVVISSAIGVDNVEVAAARAKKIPVIPRAEMLAELMRLRYGIAVAGAHGKTTTTSMIAAVLAEAGLDPTAVIGGKVNRFGSHAKSGEGLYLVAEADESDGSFLKLSPTVAVVTNLDHEHLDYYKSFEAIEAAFLDFIHRIPFYGRAILCGDQKAMLDLIPRIDKRVLTYGTTPGLNLTAGEMAFHSWQSTFHTTFFGEPLGEFMIPMPGVHNVVNALAAIGVGLELQIPVATIRRGLAGYSGVARRFEPVGVHEGVLVIDDYGHHPTEIRATLAAAKGGWQSELLVVFQPHRFTRTRDCLKELAGAFQAADHLILTDIYPAGEAPIAGIDGKRLYDEVLQTGHPDAIYCPDPGAVVALLRQKARPGMMVMTLGAGNIWKVGQAFMGRA